MDSTTFFFILMDAANEDTVITSVKNSFNVAAIVTGIITVLVIAILILTATVVTVLLLRYRQRR